MGNSHTDIESVSKVLLINEKREALILTVGEYKGRPDKAFKPDLPGGLVDPGETELVAVVREVKEEAGITVPAEAFRLVYTKTEYFTSTDTSVSKFLYTATLDHTPNVTISWEHMAYSWVSLDTLLETVELRSFYREAVAYGLAHDLF